MSAWVKRFSANFAQAIWGPPGGWGWAYRALLLIGFVPANRDTVMPVLTFLGLDWVPSYYFVLFALGVLSVGLATRVAFLSTAKVVFGCPSLIISGDAVLGRLPVKLSHMPKEWARVSLTILTLGDVEAHRDSPFTLLTEERMKRLRNTGHRHVGRIYLDATFKRIELFECVGGSIIIEHESGKTELPLSSYKMLVRVSADSGLRQSDLILLQVGQTMRLSDRFGGTEIMLSELGNPNGQGL